jgi:hypothetical protein
MEDFDLINVNYLDVLTSEIPILEKPVSNWIDSGGFSWKII